METPVKLNGNTVAVISYLTKYDHKKAEELKGTPNEFADGIFIDGKVSIERIMFLEKSYNEQAYILTWNDLKTLNEAIDILKKWNV